MFSQREEDIVKAIGRGKLTFKEIADKIFEHSYDRPFDDVITVSNSVNRIIKKCEKYMHPWTLTKSKKNGRIIIKKSRRQ